MALLTNHLILLGNAALTPNQNSIMTPGVDIELSHTCEYHYLTYMITVSSISIMTPLVAREDQAHIINNIFNYLVSF